MWSEEWIEGDTRVHKERRLGESFSGSTKDNDGLPQNRGNGGRQNWTERDLERKIPWAWGLLDIRYDDRYGCFYCAPSIISALLLEELLRRKWLAVGPWAGPRQSEALYTVSCPWNFILHAVPTAEVQRRSLEKIQCCRDHPDWICDWTQLRPLFKLFRFWLVDAEINSFCGHPRQASLEVPLLIQPVTYQSGVIGLFQQSWPPGTGNSFGVHQGISLSYKPTGIYLRHWVLRAAITQSTPG